MLTAHRATDRHAPDGAEAPAWLTLFADGDSPRLPPSYDAIELLEEGRLPPRAMLRERTLAAEVFTYVREGALTYEDSTGRIGVVRAGEFQRMSLGPGTRYSEVNASSTHWAHAFQIWFGAGRNIVPGHERLRFSLAQRRGRLCPVASPDAREGSLRVSQDVVVYSAILSRGQHVVHEFETDRSAWLHVVEGAVRVGSEQLLSAGDGLSIIAEPVVSFTAQEDTEVLFVDVAKTRPDEPGGSVIEY